MSGRKSIVRARASRQLAALLDEVQDRAVRRVRGLFLDPTDEGYNPDASVKKSEASMATLAALEIAKGTLLTERGKPANQTTVFAPVFLTPQLPGPSWEQMAKVVESTGALPPMVEEVTDEEEEEAQEAEWAHVDAADGGRQSD